VFWDENFAPRSKTQSSEEENKAKTFFFCHLIYLN